MAGAAAYGFDYRVKGTTAWRNVGAFVRSFAATVKKLLCNTTYEFIVRVYTSGSAYDAGWGFWSDVVAAKTDACPSGGR